jgi:hypothetical protein
VSLIKDVLLLAAVLAVVTVVAELAGAENLGTALTFGVIAFMATVVALMLRRG